MQLATILYEETEQPVLLKEEGAVLIRDINQLTNKAFPLSLMELLKSSTIQQLKQVVSMIEEEDWAQVSFISKESLHFVAPYREPRHILGVGMNYLAKAEDLQAKPIEGAPVVFMKPTSSLIGMNEPIELPSISQDVTAEAEISLIIGEVCDRVSEEEALSYVSGYTTSLDMTAKDIHAQNPRFVQISKVCKSFFSFGPQVNLFDENTILSDLTVETVRNGSVIASNSVKNMIYTPASIVSYISQFIVLQPGDIIMTGTPGSVSVQPGDIASCCVIGFETLSNDVI